MIRVLHVISGDLWAGAEAQAYTLISKLVAMPDTEVAAVLMNEGELAEKLRGVGATVLVADERKLGPLRILALLRRFMRNWRPDIIHTHREKENVLGALANLIAGNVPSIRTAHGASEHPAWTGWRGARQGIIAGLDRWCARSLQQRIIAVSTELARSLAKELPAGKIVVIENGVDPVDLAALVGAAVTDYRAAEPESVHVGIAGRLVPVKRVDLFLDTAARLEESRPERKWRFHVFGEGPLREQLEDRAAQLGIRDRVTFHGHRQDIAQCIAGLDVIVMCSDHEGMPMIALEAAALGVPTVAHAVGGLLDVAAKDLLVKEHDAGGYMHGVLSALGADGRASARRRAQEVLARYSARANAERVRALYEQVVVESRSG